ncbi:MAG: ABC transporter permease [Bacteroidetes bacterium]|nr:MAG: ABC transporter permease [Bacteroidota bacterium]
MRRLLFVVQKEFIQILRNKAILPLMTVVPMVQLILLSFAANNEVTNVRVVVADQDHSTFSRRLIQKIATSDRFIVLPPVGGPAPADALIQAGEADLILLIPPRFESDFFKYQTGALQLSANAINGQQATVGAVYLSAIIGSFNREIASEMPVSALSAAPAGIGLGYETAYWFNPDLNFKDFMVPGILGELVTILVMLLTAMNIVREREIGTIEQINVTPLKKWQFILGKMLPFLIIGLILLSVGLVLGKLIFDIPLRGHLGVVFAFCLFNLMAVLGLGLFISNLADTQQQAMFVTFFFVIIFILMSGLFTPIESMPEWAQYLTLPNPIAHFVHVMRSVLLKGSGWSDIAFHFKVTAVMAVLFNGMAILSYRKTG